MKYFVLFLLTSFIFGEEHYYIKINDAEYEFELKDNEAANQIKSKLPFTVKMSNLNENEIYYRFSGESFTTNEKQVGTINKGDIHLYQSNVLVLFYKTFTTSYSYTELGKLKDPTGLDTLIGLNDVEVQWFTKNSEPDETPKENTDETPEADTTQRTTKDTPDITDKDTTPTDSFERYSFQVYAKINYFIWLFLASIVY